MQVRRLVPDDAAAGSGTAAARLAVVFGLGRLYEAAGFRSFGVEPDAVRVDGHAHAKNHMHLDLNRAP